MIGYNKKTHLAFNDALDKTKAELAKEGFGVLTEIDVKATLKKKLKVDYDNYIILGVCNPSFAYKALNQNKEVGLMLPCNVIIYREGKDTFVSAVLPTKAMAGLEDNALHVIAVEVEAKLKKTIDNI